MRITIFGAAGGIGRHATERALTLGHEVTAFVRRPAALSLEHERLSVVQGDVMDPRALARALGGTGGVLSCIGNNDRKSKIRSEGMAHIIAGMQELRVRRLACVSAMGVGDSRDQANRTSFVFGRIILPLFLAEPYQDMGVMEELIRKTELEWTIVRPTALNDRPSTGQPVKVVPIDVKAGTGIPRVDVARFLVDAVVEGAYLRRAVSISS